ncbi:MAG: hypothetical protein MHM6MM_007106, partial [Cercozoa sp. M6MM]
KASLRVRRRSSVRADGSRKGRDARSDTRSYGVFAESQGASINAGLAAALCSGATASCDNSSPIVEVPSDEDDEYSACSPSLSRRSMLGSSVDTTSGLLHSPSSKQRMLAPEVAEVVSTPAAVYATRRVRQCEGVLWKKNPNAIRGLRNWKKRFVRLVAEDSGLVYFKCADDVAMPELRGEPLGTIEFARIRSCNVRPFKKPAGCRFDIEVVGGRVYEFRAQNRRECKQFVDAVLSWADLFAESDDSSNALV